MSYKQKNWRGRSVHPVDEWDDWPLSLGEYEEMRATYDRLVKSGADMDLVRKMMDYADRYRAMVQAEIDAGDSI